MCDPITAIAAGSLLLSGAGAVVNNNAQNRARKDTQRANAQLQGDTTRAADTDYLLGVRTIDQRISQEGQAAGQVLAQNATSAKRSILASTRAAAIADGQARVSAGAAGVSGASVDALLTDISRVDAENEQAIGTELNTAQRNIKSNLAMSAEQAKLEKESLDAQRRNRINGVSNLPTPAGANPWATAIQIGGAALDFGSFLTTRKP